MRSSACPVVIPQLFAVLPVGLLAYPSLIRFHTTVGPYVKRPVIPDGALVLF